MGLSELAEKNKPVTIAVTILVLVGAGVLIASNLSGGVSNSLNNPKWMFNLNTKQLVSGDASWLAPYQGDSGTYDYGELGSAGALVDAKVYSCGKPTSIEPGMTVEQLESIDAWIGYLMRTPLSDPTSVVGSGDQAKSAALELVVVSDSDGEGWYNQHSGPGRKIIDDGYKACDDGSLPTLARP